MFLYNWSEVKTSCLLRIKKLDCLATCPHLLQNTQECAHTHFFAFRKEYKYDVTTVNKNLLNKGNTGIKYFDTNLVGEIFIHK